MTVSNHLAAGAIIAVVVKQPVLALPLAYLSHFVLDALPHFGYETGSLTEAFKQRLTIVIILLNVVGVPLLIYLLWGQNIWVWLAAIVAVSPDFVWFYRYYWFERKGLTPPSSLATRFHKKIQWCEVRWGFIIEYAAFGLLSLALVKVLP